MFFKQILTLLESRKNPHINKKTTIIDDLKHLQKEIDEKKLDVKDFFVSFMSLNKTGINPSSHFNTPVGLYCYPLSFVWSKHKQRLTDSLGLREYPEDRVGYIKIYKIKDYSKVYKLRDQMSDEFLNQFYEQYPDLLPYDPVTFGDLYELVYSEILQYEKNEDNDYNINPSKTAKNSTSIFRQLGIDGLIDEGDGIIHENEPEQAVFFNVRVLELIKNSQESNLHNFQQLQNKPTPENIISLLHNLIQYPTSHRDIIMFNFFKYYKQDKYRKIINQNETLIKLYLDELFYPYINTSYSSNDIYENKSTMNLLTYNFQLLSQINQKLIIQSLQKWSRRDKFWLAKFITAYIILDDSRYNNFCKYIAKNDIKPTIIVNLLHSYERIKHNKLFNDWLNEFLDDHVKIDKFTCNYIKQSPLYNDKRVKLKIDNYIDTHS